jgi:hypothetical protein|tara:strand:- start:419 stop:541 length:123 start_codon:yes stop_codon:yes gene_type:complete
MPAWISNADKHPNAVTLPELKKKLNREIELKRIILMGIGK